MKAKMLKTSKELLVNHEYGLFRTLMTAIKDLEKQINSNQNQMRQKIYKDELDLYHDIGGQKMEGFFQEYEKKFKTFNFVKKKRSDNLITARSVGKDDLHQRLSRVTECFKFKPRTKLREFRTQETLLALEERVSEAQNLRKELKKMNKDEGIRLTGL